MIRFVELILVGSIFCAVRLHAGRTVSIDEAIEDAEETSFDAQIHQADGSILVGLDMRFTKEQWALFKDMQNGTSRQKRNALRNLQKRWENGVVPYVVSSGFTDFGQKKIKEGVNEWNKYSCVYIRPKTSSDKYFVNIVPTGGCTSYVGTLRSSVGQRMTLGRGCWNRGIVAHEFGHALGFHHEQTRPDRDQYVRILEENITPQYRFAFQKYNWRMINAYDVPYDYESVMHYGPYAFSQNRKLTIQTVDPKYQNVIGNRYGISYYDIKLINLMYDCPKKCPKKTCPGDGFVGKDCKCWCKGPSRQQPAIYCDSKKPVGGGITPGPKPTQPPTTGDIDNHPNCPGWAARGECKRNPGYMLKNCKKSCKNVSGGSGGGNGGGGSGEVDNHRNCPDWAKHGECKKNPGYMLKNCRKSCKAVGAL